MAYKNSAAVKFNDATDLIIRADPDGTVESCFNKADNTEYITATSIPVNVTLTLTNSTDAARSYNNAYVDNNGVIVGPYRRGSINPAETQSIPVLKHAIMQTQTGYTWNVISGDAVVDGFSLLVNSDATVEIISE